MERRFNPYVQCMSERNQNRGGTATAPEAPEATDLRKDQSEAQSQQAKEVQEIMSPLGHAYGESTLNGRVVRNMFGFLAKDTVRNVQKKLGEANQATADDVTAEVVEQLANEDTIEALARGVADEIRAVGKALRAGIAAGRSIQLKGGMHPISADQNYLGFRIAAKFNDQQMARTFSTPKQG